MRIIDYDDNLRLKRESSIIRRIIDFIKISEL